MSSCHWLASPDALTYYVFYRDLQIFERKSGELESSAEFIPFPGPGAGQQTISWDCQSYTNTMYPREQQG